ncbi:MAG TPA: hypothetical protein VG755_08560, partial [Nannocystaceae bacterium]|nr:hypothetical protein [Nannocystaceae bacterium]
MATELPIDGDEREHLLAALAELIAARGWQHFVLAPIVLPTERFFPDRWTPDEDGVGLLAMRLLRYAGLGELGVQLQLFAEHDAARASGGLVQSERHAGAAAWFAGIDDGVCRFGTNIDKLGDALGVTAALAHESAHAVRRYHALEVADVQTEEQLTDLTAVYLGFGVLLANAAARHRSWNVAGDPFVSARSFESLGYLSPQAQCFAIACQTTARGGRDAAVERALATNQAGWYRAASTWLEREGGDLLARLGIPPRSTWPAPFALAGLLQPIELEPDDAPLPSIATSPTRTAARVPTSRGLGLAVVGGVGGLVAGIAAVAEPWGVAAGLLLGAIAGAWSGRRLPAWHCSSCDMRVRRRDEQCPGCGSRFVRELARRDDRLDDPDEDEREREAARAVSAVAPYRSEGDGLPFAPEDIDGSELAHHRGVARVSSEGDTVGRFELERVQKRLDVVLSRSHADYLETLGAGVDSDLIEVWSPARIVAERAEVATWLAARHWDADDALADLDPRLLVVVGATFEGDRIAVHPGYPKHVLWLRAEVGEIVDLGQDIHAAFDEVCALPSDCVRWFAPPSLRVLVEVTLPAALPLVEVLRRVLAFGPVCLQREHEETDDDERWLVLAPGIGGTVRIGRTRSGPWTIELATDTRSVDAGQRMAASL